MQLNYRDSKPIYEQIKEGIRRMIVMNVIKQDEKLPSVRVLACKYAINPNTIAKAYRELEEEGYLYTKSGKGTFVADAKTARQSLTRNLKILFDQVVTELFVLETPVEELKTRMDDAKEQDIVLSNGAYSGINKPFKTLEEVGKISDSVYRQKLSLYGCELDIYVFKTHSNIWSMLMHNAPIIVFLMLINVFFPLCLLRIFNHSFTSRILQLSKVFKSVDSEKLVSMTDRESKDEIGSMIKNYNRMVSRTNDLIQTVYKNKLKEQEMLVSQKNAELLALHSQINPHFLFNALESIRMHSLLKKENETADMVEKLAIMQRQYVEWGNDAVTVAKECEFVKAYLALQKYRFGERLNYNIDIEADCMECQVPKLTLVTFVENACVHGIESKAAPGWIFVRIFKKAGFMHIEVEDTGSGIDPDALEK